MLLSEFKAETKRLDSFDKGQREEQEGNGPVGGILMDVRSGQKATLEKVKKQKKNQESMTSQKSKKERYLPERAPMLPALAGTTQCSTRNNSLICPEKKDNFKGKESTCQGESQPLEESNDTGCACSWEGDLIKIPGNRHHQQRGIQEPSAP